MYDFQANHHSYLNRRPHPTSGRTSRPEIPPTHPAATRPGGPAKTPFERVRTRLRAHTEAAAVSNFDFDSFFDFICLKALWPGLIFGPVSLNEGGMVWPGLAQGLASLFWPLLDIGRIFQPHSQTPTTLTLRS